MVIGTTLSPSDSKPLRVSAAFLRELLGGLVISERDVRTMASPVSAHWGIRISNHPLDQILHETLFI